MPSSLVSIAMPVYNACRTLPVALRSILSQTHTDWELLLIDDGSGDLTLGQAYSAARRDSRIHVIEGKTNTGLATRLNQAIDMANGDFIARMDADDVAYPGRLAAQVKFMNDHAECDLVGCGALIFDDAGQVQGKFPLRLTHEGICVRPWAGFPLPHPTWLGRRDWFARYRYLPNFKKTQDQDLLLRAYLQSRFACVPEILLGYRQERRTLQKLLRGRQNFSRSIARESWRQREILAGLFGLAGQAAKAVVDLITVPLGWDRLLRGESALAVLPAEIDAWRTVWADATTED